MVSFNSFDCSAASTAGSTLISLEFFSISY
jgi:hypothetical protein